MTEELSANAHEVIEWARADALRRNQHFVEPENIALGLLERRSCIAALLLQRGEVNVGALRTKLVEGLAGAQRQTAIDATEVPMSTAAQEVIRLATDAMNQAQQGVVGTEHLLLGLIGQRPEDVSPYFQVGVKRARVVEAIRIVVLDVCVEDCTTPLAKRYGFVPTSEKFMAIRESRLLGIPFASIENGILKMEPGQNLQSLVPLEFAKTNGVFPLFIEDNCLSVAMADPGDRSKVTALRRMTGMKIQPFITTPSEIDTAIRRFYSHE